MPQPMQVVRGLLAANPDYWPAKTNADGTTSSAYLRATVYEDRPRVRQKDGSYTDNPLGNRRWKCVSRLRTSPRNGHSSRLCRR